MTYLAGIEIDRIQEIIFQSDKLKEMIGASRLIDETINSVERIINNYQQEVELVWRVSGVFKLRSRDLPKLGSCLWEIRTHFSRELGLASTAGIVEEKPGWELWTNLANPRRQDPSG